MQIIAKKLFSAKLIADSVYLDTIMTERNYSYADKLCLGLDQALRALTGHAKTTGQPYPAIEAAEASLTDAERKHAAGLMRVNHTGEICAQGLYHGQAMVCRSAAVAAQLQQAAIEEGDHLDWCQRRLLELSSHTSYLNPFWYAGSFCIGMVAGIAGDQWSLGFVAETEQQVIKHLRKHKALLPSQDQRSYLILQRMENEEEGHRQEAIAMGAKILPKPIQYLMAFTSKIMVNTTYWV